jgi:DNA primase
VGILAEDIDRVRTTTDFVAIASEHVALRKVGRRWQGLCPFHAEKTPSFSVNAEEGLFYCFGCQAKGDIISFVEQIEHLSFPDAVERLASRAGISLRYDETGDQSRDRQEKAKLGDAMARAVEWYHQRLLTSPDAGKARGYLKSRGYDGEIVRAYKLGWAPDEWDTLARALALPDEVLEKTGLGFKNRAGKQQDAFRARILFPIFDVRGDAVALGGRVMPGADGPKYKNSPETRLYAKSKVLYGLNWAKSPIVDAGEVIVCEGYTDVIGFAQAGLPRAVATCGTALTDEHFRLLKNFARRIVLAYDADAAGQAAAERFYEWEQKFEVQVLVADLPPGGDPADLARTDPPALEKAVVDAKPFLKFRLDRLLARADLRTIEGKARVAGEAAALIREHPNAIVREQYQGQVAVRLDLPTETLVRAVNNQRAPRVDAPPARPRDTERPGPELEALKLAVLRRDDIIDRLDEALFEDDRRAAAWRALATSATVHEAIDAADPDTATLLQRLAVEDTAAEPDDVVARVVEECGRREMTQLNRDALADESRFQDEHDVRTWLRVTLEQLRDPQTAVEAAEVLVPWLVERRRVEE